MKAKELKQWANQFEDDEEIIITGMDDYFSCESFSLHSPYNDGQAQEIILPYYFDRFLKERGYNVYICFRTIQQR